MFQTTESLPHLSPKRSSVGTLTSPVSINNLDDEQIWRFSGAIYASRTSTCILFFVGHTFTSSENPWLARKRNSGSDWHFWKVFSFVRSIFFFQHNLRWQKKLKPGFNELVFFLFAFSPNSCLSFWKQWFPDTYISTVFLFHLSIKNAWPWDKLALSKKNFLHWAPNKKCPTFDEQRYEW